MIGLEGGINIVMIYFNKQLNCPKCKEAIMAVGNVLGEPMTTGPENVIAYDVHVGKLMSTDGPKEDITFKINCPECDHEIDSEVIRDIPNNN